MITENPKYYEDGIVNSIFAWPQEHPKIFSRIQPEHFATDFNKKVFSILSRLHEETRPDQISNEVIISELCTMLKGQGKDWRFWTYHFVKESPLPADIDFYIKRIIQNYNKRRIVEISNAATKRIDDGQGSDEVGAFTKTEIDKLESGNVEGGPVCFYDVAADCIEQLESGGESITGIKTGFSEIDHYIIGMRPGDLIVIAGRPSMGKTTLVMNIARTAALAGNVGLIFSLEMSQYRLGLRMLASDTGENLYNLSTGKITDYSKLVNVGAGLKNIYIDFTTGLLATDIKSRVREFTETKQIDFIALDYLGKLRFRGKERHDLEVGNATVLFKNIAKDYNVPFILLSQLNRANEKDGKAVRKPRLSDLRDSGSIEQDADIVMFVHREEVYKPDELKYKNKAEIILAKNRDGDVGISTLTFRKKFNRFENYTEEEY